MRASHSLCLCIYLFIFIYKYMRMYIRNTYIHTYINTHINTYVHTYVQAYIHTYIYTNSSCIPESTLHTRRSSTQSDKYQVPHRYIHFSWWWAHSRPKRVEKGNKHTKNSFAPSCLYLQDCVRNFDRDSSCRVDFKPKHALKNNRLQNMKFHIA